MLAAELFPEGHREPVFCAYCQTKITLIDVGIKGIRKVTCPRCGKDTHVMVTANQVVHTVKAQT
jgi:endogenous inhibitor of DNA gyrase (YacG/DUF329 family)